MSAISIVLYLIVILIIILGSRKRFMRSKKAALIMFSVSPIYLFATYFVFPYMSLRGNYGGMPGFIYSFARDMGFSQYNSALVRNFVFFVLFWAVFFKLSSLTFEFIYKKQSQEKPSEDNPFE